MESMYVFGDYWRLYYSIFLFTDLECCSFICLLSCPSMQFFAPTYHDLQGLNHLLQSCGSQHNILKEYLLPNQNCAFCPEDYLMLCCRSWEWMGRATEERASKPQQTQVLVRMWNNRNFCWEEQNRQNHLGKQFSGKIVHSGTLHNKEKRTNPSVNQQWQANLFICTKLIIMQLWKSMSYSYKYWHMCIKNILSSAKKQVTQENI